jgi:hypothetical protein
MTAPAIAVDASISSPMNCWQIAQVPENDTTAIAPLTIQRLKGVTHSPPVSSKHTRSTGSDYPIVDRLQRSLSG